jgi:hypothetical protein
MSLIAGIALGAAAIIALISGNVLGLAAANGWTEIAWGAAAAILLFNTVIPRRKKTVEEPDRSTEPRRRVEPAAAPSPQDNGRRSLDEQEIGARPVARQRPGADQD